MVMIKREINQQDFIIVNLHFVKSEKNCSQLQVMSGAADELTNYMCYLAAD